MSCQKKLFVIATQIAAPCFKSANRLWGHDKLSMTYKTLYSDIILDFGILSALTNL
jgi:hypothetical protein